MENNNIINLEEPSDPKDAVSERFHFKQLQKLADNYNLVVLSSKIIQIRSGIKAIQVKLTESERHNRSTKLPNKMNRRQRVRA